jgi:YbgC/YbaW family acyl-CoA thioester hydrolase
VTSLPTVDVTVYPFDCDAFGHLNQGACLVLLERARWDALARGPGADLFHRAGVVPAARRTTIDYLAPGYAGDVLRVETTVVERGTTSFTLRQRATRSRDGAVIAEADLGFVCVDRAGRPTPIPEEVARVLGSPRGRDVQRVAVDAGELTVEMRGAGRAVLLVHGFPFDRTMWRHQLAGLSRWRRIAPDLRGFGGSADAPMDLEAASLARHADDLAAVLDALGEPRAVVCGLSMGGYIAFELVRRHAARIRALILMDTRPEADDPAGRRTRDEMAAIALRQGAGAIAARLLPRLLADATSESQPDTVAHVRDMMERASPHAIAAALRAMRDRADSRDLLGEIAVPTLALGGAEDALTPPAVMRSMAAAIPGARFVEVPAAGHLAPLEQPLAVNRLVTEFLDGLPPGD